MNRLSIILLCFVSVLPTLLCLNSKIQLPSQRVPYLGTGYDLRVGNPEGTSLYSNDGDPGLRPTRLIVLDYKESCPFCVNVVNTWSTKEYLADDLNKYYQQIQDRWVNLEEDEDESSAPCENSWYHQKPILKVGGSCQVLQEARNLLTVKKGVMVTKEISQIYLEARLNKHKYILNPEFERTVCSSLFPKKFTNDTRKEFTSFFKTWGTHVIVELSLGEKEIQRRIYTERNGFKAYGKTPNFKSLSISSNYDAKFIPGILEALSKIKPNENYTFVYGSKDVPIPIRIHLEPISNFVSCSSETNNSELKELLEEATKDYLTTGTYYQEEFDSVVVRKYDTFDLKVWPGETYSLPKPKAGCPKDWSYGYRHHDTEDTPPHKNSYHRYWNALMYPNAKEISSFLIFEFCTKTHERPFSARSWGEGSYCIFKYGSTCPTGFTDAHVFIDDEDSGNMNHINGTLPRGQYDADTIYHLCCRNDGEDFPLFLPNDFPFVLLPITGKAACQPVFGMDSKMLWATIDGEDSGTSYCSPGPLGPLCEKGPFNTLKIFFCYYEHLEVTATRFLPPPSIIQLPSLSPPEP